MLLELMLAYIQQDRFPMTCLPDMKVLAIDFKAKPPLYPLILQNLIFSIQSLPLFDVLDILRSPD